MLTLTTLSALASVSATVADKRNLAGYDYDAFLEEFPSKTPDEVERGTRRAIF